MTTNDTGDGDSGAGNRPADDNEDRRLFLEKMAGFVGGALVFLSFPGPARAADAPWEPPKGAHSASSSIETFPQCDIFNQYSGGDDCTTGFTCGDAGFHCEGGALDDFECTGAFVCTQFLCSYSFDDEDCEAAGQFHCNQVGPEFICSEGYN